MRVTNGMLSNNMILGLNKNMNKLNTLYDQMNSLKKIQRPSDDPIILGRSLKLRLNVLETEQYKTNTGEARSWMEISEGSMNNTSGILNDIRKEAVQAANGTLGHEDRSKIATTIEQLKKQLIQESNANYAGRSVFGGYKTDQKVLFDKQQLMEPPAKFQQEFNKQDIETVTYRGEDYYRIRLPYGDIDPSPAPGVSITDGPAPGIKNIKSDYVYYNGDFVEKTPTVEVNIAAEIEAGTYKPESMYHPPIGTAYFIEDTGELILNKENYNAITSETKIDINYSKTNFKAGDPNPAVFFNTEPDSDPTIYVTAPGSPQKDSQKLEYEIGIGTKLDVNVLGSKIFTPMLLRDIDELIQLTTEFEEKEESIKNQQEAVNLSRLFTKGIGKMDDGLKALSHEQADLGSRMKRLELTEKRLGDDEVSYTELLSKTEDVELERAFIDFNTQYAVYQSALQVTAKVVQPTLMDFLR